ncbi:hypothetical protein [Longimicrobium terrae]|uniref:Uncharacterized protein n=1 Tax=Longimicrobium terrae TaxID=1639882 RepID=A0A841GRG2_9BACT|nr:hypothetical protein [Longimicrobium terrae]MBB4634261.1 hypothetical protein [Longimicrobium terrae]MBB6068849.1 hypothetical protein [Longimicrobium terrae]NNC28029.1 hypothetical protein [Longimicrobium terrae]
MAFRVAYAALLALAAGSACDRPPATHPWEPWEKHVITTTELLGDTSNLSTRAKHHDAVDFAWEETAFIEWTTAKQGTAYVIPDVVVRFPPHSANVTYRVEHLRVWKPESRFTTTRMTASLQISRTGRWGEHGASVTLHPDGRAVVGMYRHWRWGGW